MPLGRPDAIVSISAWATSLVSISHIVPGGQQLTDLCQRNGSVLTEATHGSIIMTIEHFQNLVIGSGVAGKLLAWTLASQGQKTVVVERAMIGGACPNVACLP